MNLMQIQARDAVGNDLWSRDQIMFKLVEEVGELAKAFRHGDRDEAIGEIGDVQFALCCLCEREDMDLQAAFNRAVEKHKAAPIREYHESRDRPEGDS